MNVLILDRNMPKSRHSGKMVLVENKIRELSAFHTLHYVYFPQPGETAPSLEAIRPYPASLTVMPLDYRSSLWGRIRTWFSLMPWYFLRWRYPEDREKVRAALRIICKARDIEVVDCFNAQTVQFAVDLDLPILNQHNDSKRLHIMRRRKQSRSPIEKTLLWISELRTRRYEDWAIRFAQASVFLSADDTLLYRKPGQQEKIHVIPNGVDTEYFSQSKAGKEAARPTLLFTGHMSYGPNIDTALRLCREMLPRLRRAGEDVRVIIAGADPTREILALHDGMSVIVTGRVSDLRPHFEEAWIYVCPMRLGAGIKNKLLEAMAMGKAIVTSRIATQGILFDEGDELVVADEIGDMAQAVIRLLRSTPARAEMGARARRRVERDYQWSAIGERHARLLEDVARACRHPSEGAFHYATA